MNNSQFWTWTDHWQGWDWMREEDEAELELAEWADETLWMICLMCGSPVEGCMCENIEDATPTPPLDQGPPAPLPVSLNSRERRIRTKEPTNPNLGSLGCK